MRWPLLAVALAVVAAGCGGEREPPVPKGRYVAANRALTPKAHLFGEPVVARVDVVVDRDQLDPDRVRLKAAFSPYQRVGETVVERRDFARHTRLRFETTLRCLSVRCLPRRPPALDATNTGIPYRDQLVSRFKPAHVYYDDPETGRTRLLRRVWWPSLESISNLDLTDPRVIQQENPGRFTLSPLPEVTYRVAPPLLAVMLALAAAGLLAFPAVLVFRRLESRRPPPPAPEPELSPLERALLLVARADNQDRREALEALALELDAVDREEQSEAARLLAWSNEPPSSESAHALVQSATESRGTV